MSYYIYLFSPETYESFTRSDRTIAGVRKHQAKTAQRLQLGDRLVCYVTKVGRWAGILEVKSPAFEDSTPLFMPSGDPFIIRFKVLTHVWLPIEKCVPIKEHIVWNQLSFTKAADIATRRTWNFVVRRSLNQLKDEDGIYLEQLLHVQKNNSVDYPLDPQEWRRLVAKPIYRTDKAVVVTVPTNMPFEDEPEVASSYPRESHSVQAKLAAIGEVMGFKIWIPKADRSSVLKEWTPRPGTLLEFLPLNYDETTLQTIEQIDVLWLRGRSIIRAFEVEHTTSVYSGLLRMADLLALQPNMNIKLHIVAPEVRKEKVFHEIRRPVFSLLERGPLCECCTFISYESLKELCELPHLSYTSDRILEEYEEEAE
ncbi:MAG: hypothetical protein RMJ88_03145 [Thermogemmata sp.]|nr:hypothetical protein [Thermogemmata sp.]